MAKIILVAEIEVKENLQAHFELYKEDPNSLLQDCNFYEVVIQRTTEEMKIKEDANVHQN